MPRITVPAVASAAAISPVLKLITLIRCARYCACRFSSMARSIRPEVRRATPYARITPAPTTDSATAASIAPIFSRTSRYRTDSCFCRPRMTSASGRNAIHTSSVSCHE